MVSTHKTVQYKDNSAEGATIFAATHDYEDIRSFEIQEGRYFSLFESNTGRNKAVIGAVIAEKLFPDEDPIGKTIKILGHKIMVIGIFKKEGSDAFGISNDEQVLLPVNLCKNHFGYKK